MNKAFESKVAELIAVTRRLDVPQTLVVRRLTLTDPEALKWANDKQLNVVFDVILNTALERLGNEALYAARQASYAPLLPPGFEGLEENKAILSRLVDSMLEGWQPPAEEEEPGLDSLDASAAADFGTLFDSTICAYTRAALKPLGALGRRNDVMTPFIMAPKFPACYEQVLREFVLPTMRATKKIKSLGAKHDWSKVGAGKLIEIIQKGGDSNNPVLHQWDMRWESFHAERAGSKVKEPKPEDNPWPVFQAHAEKHGYIPPTEYDIPVLKGIIRWIADDIGDAWREISQLYQQEFAPKNKSEQARPGAFRDGVIKWIERLPHHLGDQLAIRTHYDFPKVDRLYLRTMIQTLGRSERERMAKAPLLVDFFQNLPK